MGVILHCLTFLFHIQSHTLLCSSSPRWPLPSLREVAKNAMLRWAPFVYWTILGIYQGLLFFFGVRYLFSNPALQDNGQVSSLGLAPAYTHLDAKPHGFDPYEAIVLRDSLALWDIVGDCIT